MNGSTADEWLVGKEMEVVVAYSYTPTASIFVSYKTVVSRWSKFCNINGMLSENSMGKHFPSLAMVSADIYILR
jgi:hypothetical protein